MNLESGNACWAPSLKKPETFFRAAAAGSAPKPEETTEYEALVKQFLQKETQNVKAGEDAVKKRKMYRLASRSHLHHLDHVIRIGTGEGLAQFIPRQELRKLLKVSWACQGLSGSICQSFGA